MDEVWWLMHDCNAIKFYPNVVQFKKTADIHENSLKFDIDFISIRNLKFFLVLVDEKFITE